MQRTLPAVTLPGMRLAVWALLLGVGAASAACFLWPAAVAVAQSVRDFDPAVAAMSGRRITLLLRGVGVAAAGSALSLVFGAGLAAGLAAQRGRWLRNVAAWVAAVVLLTPPYVYAYAWSLPLLTGGAATSQALAARVLGPVVTFGRAVWCLACWTAPLAAVIVACGWRTSGRPAWALALLDAGAGRAVWRAAAPAMGPWFAAALLAVGLLTLTEYTVCNLCLVQTWNTEVLAETQLLGAPGRALLLTWPLLALVGVLLLAGLALRTRFALLLDDLAGLQDEPPGAAPRGKTRGMTLAVCAASALLLCPIGIMIAWLEHSAALGRTWQTFGENWGRGLLAAGGSGLIAVSIALGVDYALAPPRWVARSAGRSVLRCAARVVVAVAIVAAVAPPVLVGDALLAAYIHWPRVSDTMLIVSFCGAARYTAVAVLLVWMYARLQARHVPELAAGDRADWDETYLRLRLPLIAPAGAIAFLVVGVLSLTEIGATQLIIPHGADNLALTMLNQIHFGRNDEVSALLLYLVALVASVVSILALVQSFVIVRIRRQSSEHGKAH